MTEDHSASVDVLVIGAGGCGLTAALAAHDAGVDVAILEKAHTLGGNTALSSGSIPAAQTRFQASAGVEKTVPPCSPATCARPADRMTPTRWSIRLPKPPAR
ncbi:MAG: FAD-dependent oxidoreductase [Phyllobacteriaceae bacterium]|nr:FAD-dependent oxidoreductase [Phyllobacteriaceae bacterium]